MENPVSPNLPDAYPLRMFAACIEEFGNWRHPMLKHPWDLLRYAELFGRPPLDQPPFEVIVETGTRTGHSAAWLALTSGRPVITVDVWPQQCPEDLANAFDEEIHFVEGDSVDPNTFARVRNLVAGRAAFVVLDSDHSRAHVRREIELYSQLVGIGSHLVIEDGVLAWLDAGTLAAHACDYDGNVLEAIYDTMYGEPVNALDSGGSPAFERDMQIEMAWPATMHPSGWWRRVR